MRKILRVKLPKPRREEEEFRSQGGLVLCPDCHSVYHKKRWQHSVNALGVKEVEQMTDKDTKIKFQICPACKMIQRGQYEGRIRIYAVPPQSEKALEELIRGFCRGAFEIDPMDRLIGIKKGSPSTGHAYRQAGSGQTVWTVTTTENQLANKVGRRIKNIFPRAKVKTKFTGGGSDVAEVVVEFPKNE